MSKRTLHLSLSAGLLTIVAAVAACASHDSDLAVQAASSRTFSEQVAVGRNLFAKNCASCHGDSGQGAKAPRLVGLKEGALPVNPPADREFRTSRFVTVADVADFVVHNMPPKKAGSLSNDEYWAILAFDLQANGINLDRKLTPEYARTLTIPH